MDTACGCNVCWAVVMAQGSVVTLQVCVRIVELDVRTVDTEGFRAHTRGSA